MSDFDLAGELEHLTHLGYAPQVIYDGKGNFAITDAGYGLVRVDCGDTFTFGIYGETSWFKPTLEEALKDFIERLEEF